MAIYIQSLRFMTCPNRDSARRDPVCISAAQLLAGSKWLFLFLTLLLTIENWAADNDFAAPVVTITSHTHGQIVNTKSIVLTGTATDADRGGNGISSVYARGTITGATATGSATVNWSQTIMLNPGANLLEVYAYDNSEAKNSITLPITINFQPLDSLPPEISITSHQNGETVNTKTIVVSGTATDAGRGDNGISSVYLRGTIAGAVAQGAGTATWSQTITLNPGVNNLEVYAYDNSDVQNSKVQPLTINFQPVDPLPPNILVLSHTNGQIVASSTIQLSGTASDAGRGNSGISSIYVRGTLPNVAAIGAETAAWSTSVSLFPGPNHITVYAYDNSDVQNEATQSLTINFQPGDTLGPILSVTSHVDGETVTASQITLRGTASDAGRGDRGISSVYVQGKLPDTSAQGAATVEWSKTIELSPGRNSITVYAYDGNEFPNETSQTLTIHFQPSDALGPVLAITSHTDGQIVQSSVITLVGTATDAGRGGSGISAVTLRGRIDAVTAAGNETANWSRTVELTPGRNVIFVTASDNAPFPNQTTASIEIILQPTDTLPPALTVLSPADGQTVFTNVITVTGTATDAGRGDHGVSFVRVKAIRAEGDTAVGAGVANWSRTFALNPGINHIQITAADASEFPQETNVTLTVTYQSGDLTPPTITIDTPRNNQTVNVNTIVVAGSVTDAGTGSNGIAEVRVNDTIVPGVTAVGGAAAAFSHTVNLVAGVNVISVVALDNSANRNSAAQTITVTYDPVDSLPPIISIESHRNNQTVNTPSIVLLGRATDEGQGNNGISGVTVDDLPAAGGTAAGAAVAQWTRELTLSLGPNVISVVARDDSPAKNSAARTITIVYEPVDVTPPTLESTSHRTGHTVLTSQITLTGIATDADRGDNGIRSVTVNGVAATGGSATGVGTASWSRDLTLERGQNVISIVAQDGRTNSASLTLVLTFDPDAGNPGSQEFCWLRSSSSDGADAAYSVALDRAGNSYVTGVFEGTTTFGTTNLVSHGESDIFVAKYDPSGNVLWALQAGGPKADAAYGIAVDAEGNPCITGYFTGEARFGAELLETTGIYDLVLAKFDSNGQLLWASTTGSSTALFGQAVAVDGKGDTYVAGAFSQNAWFEDVEFENNDEYDAFVAKYSAEGELLWAYQLGGDEADQATGIGVDANGQCYVTGYFEDLAFFGEIDLVSRGGRNLFVGQLDADGELVWVNQAGAAGKAQGTAIAVTPNGTSIVTGYFDGTARFGPNTTLSARGTYDLCLASFNANGDFLWATNTTESAAILGAGVGIDREGNSYVTGSFTGSAVFGDRTLTNTTGSDIFLAQYDGEGRLLWVKQAGGDADSAAYAMAVDAAGVCVLVGAVQGTTSFGHQTLTGNQNGDVAIAKILGNGAGPVIGLTIERLTSSQFKLQFLGDPCAGYRLQGSANFQQWITLPTTNNLSGHSSFLETAPAAPSYRFFRVVSP